MIGACNEYITVDGRLIKEDKLQPNTLLEFEDGTKVTLCYKGAHGYGYCYGERWFFYNDLYLPSDYINKDQKFKIIRQDRRSRLDDRRARTYVQPGTSRGCWSDDWQIEGLLNSIYCQ